MTKRPSLASSMKALAEQTAPDPVALVQREAPAAPPATASAPARQTAPRKATPRAELKKMLIPTDPSKHKKLKLLAVQKDMTLEGLANLAFDELLAKHS